MQKIARELGVGVSVVQRVKQSGVRNLVREKFKIPRPPVPDHAAVRDGPLWISR